MLRMLRIPELHASIAIRWGKGWLRGSVALPGGINGGWTAPRQRRPTGWDKWGLDGSAAAAPYRGGEMGLAGARPSRVGEMGLDGAH
jgi:hypothetical protein